MEKEGAWESSLMYSRTDPREAGRRGGSGRKAFPGTVAWATNTMEN